MPRVVRAQHAEPLSVQREPARGALVRKVDDLHEVATREAFIEREEPGASFVAVAHHRGELDVQVRAEPVPGLERVQQLLRGRGPEGVISQFVGQEFFLADELRLVAVPADAARPIVR